MQGADGIAPMNQAELDTLSECLFWSGGADLGTSFMRKAEETGVHLC
jgi:hypothetical protein